MLIFRDEKFEDKVVYIDNRRFIGCVFVNCSLVYSGGKIPTFDQCTFDASGVKLAGEAANTLEFMTALYHSGFQAQIEATIEEMKSNKPAVSYI